MADRLCLDRWFTLSNGQGQVLLRAQLGVSVRRRGGRGEAGSEGYVAHDLLICLDPGVPALRGGSSQP